MDPLNWAAIAALALASGFFSSYLGFGGGIVIVSLLPVIAGVSPADATRAALLLILFLSLFNTVIFARKRLIDWNYALSMTAGGSLTAFFAGRAAPDLSDFSLRLFLWFCLFFVAAFSAFFLKRSAAPHSSAETPAEGAKESEESEEKETKRPKEPKLEAARLNKKRAEAAGRRFFKMFAPVGGGALMGIGSGLSGFSGGVILSPLLHETRALPLKNISPVLSFTAFGLAVFALLGHQIEGGPFSESLQAAFPVLLTFSFSGLAAGHFFHKQKDRSRRIVILRSVTGALFLTVSVDLALMLQRNGIF